MFLTKECDYGIRVIRAVAGGEKKTVEAIAKEELIPSKYAYKIVKKVERAGLVKSIRGRNGGYLLTKPLDDFTLLDIITAIDADRYVNECLQGDATCVFKDNPDKPCGVHLELVRLQGIIAEGLNSKSMTQVFEAAPH